MSVVIIQSPTESHLSFLVPRVCDACKETDENDNEIVDNLCKNDFGKSAHSHVFFSSSFQGVGPPGDHEVVMKLMEISGTIVGCVLFLRMTSQCV